MWINFPILALLAACWAVTAFAQDADIDPIQKLEIQTLTQSQLSQARINKTDVQTAKIAAEYRTIIAQIESLKKYNREMQRLITAQDKEKIAIREQIDQAKTIDRHVFPLMHRMIDSLEQFIALDMPFLPSERRGRLAGLKALMARSDATPAEKFRKILEAYEIELDYGRTIESWQGTKSKISVDYMRFGRLAWLYQTFDRNETALWNPAKKEWTILYGWSSDIRQAIKVAREQAPPALLLFPFEAPVK